MFNHALLRREPGAPLRGAGLLGLETTPSQLRSGACPSADHTVPSTSLQAFVELCRAAGHAGWRQLPDAI